MKIKRTQSSRDADIAFPHERLSEAEISLLMQEAARSYEEYTQLAELADLNDSEDVIQPQYNWDSPMGLVVTGQKHTKLI